MAEGEDHTVSDEITHPVVTVARILMKGSMRSMGLSELKEFETALHSIAVLKETDDPGPKDEDLDELLMWALEHVRVVAVAKIQHKREMDKMNAELRKLRDSQRGDD